MNITDKVLGNEEYRNKYLNKLDTMSGEIEMFKSFQKQLSEAAKAKQKKEAKSKKGKDTIVSEATSRDDIRKLIVTLKLKITEILSGDDDDKLKNIRVNALNQKIAALERILSKIRQQEAEKAGEKNSKNRTSERVRLSKDDLTLESTGGGAADSLSQAISGVAGAVDSGTINIATDMADLVSGMTESQTVDVTI